MQGRFIHLASWVWLRDTCTTGGISTAMHFLASQPFRSASDTAHNVSENPFSLFVTLTSSERFRHPGHHHRRQTGCQTDRKYQFG